MKNPLPVDPQIADELNALRRTWRKRTLITTVATLGYVLPGVLAWAVAALPLGELFAFGPALAVAFGCKNLINRLFPKIGV